MLMVLKINSETSPGNPIYKYQRFWDPKKNCGLEDFGNKNKCSFADEDDSYHGSWRQYLQLLQVLKMISSTTSLLEDFSKLDPHQLFLQVMTKTARGLEDYIFNYQGSSKIIFPTTGGVF